MPSSVTRRLLLKASLAGGIYSLPGARLAFGAAATGPANASFQTLLTSHRELLAIGYGYCAAHPGEGSEEVLAGHIEEAVRGAGFEAVFRSEFADGNTSRVNGWLLARTEARYYALCYLQAAHRG